MDRVVIPEPLFRSPRWPFAICAAMAAVIFVADVLLPRGATAAIGYCLIPVAAAGARRRGFLLLVTIVCTVLTAAGYFIEAPGARWWTSVFDRIMVMGVLWLTFVLVNRRLHLIQLLLTQSQSLSSATTELRRSNSELQRFASVVAHDLRGPLNTIGLLAQSLEEYGCKETKAECSECAGSISHELARMNGLIQSLLAYGRAGARELRPSDCDTALILDEVQQRLKADLEASRARITSGPLPVMQGDPVLLGQLFQNLIENSIKYRGEAPPAIHVSAAREPKAWVFSVRDNGIGIRSEDLDRIFAPFHQLGTGGGGDGRERKPISGVGLGLATCKRIVEKHRGQISAQSKLGEGTTFSFTLPDLPPAADISAECRPGRSPVRA